MPLSERQNAFWAEYCRIVRQSGDTFDPVPDPTKIISPAPDELRAKIDARNREILPPAPLAQPKKPAVPAVPAVSPVAPVAGPAPRETTRAPAPTKPAS